MHATLRSLHRLREALSQIGSAVSASAQYSRSSAGRDDPHDGATDGSRTFPILF